MKTKNVKALPKQERVLTYLQNNKGKTLTPTTAKTRFNVGNLRATVSDLRDLYGSDIITTTRNSKGVLAYTYGK